MGWLKEKFDHVRVGQLSKAFVQGRMVCLRGLGQCDEQRNLTRGGWDDRKQGFSNQGWMSRVEVMIDDNIFFITLFNTIYKIIHNYVIIFL